jgi:addiction module HigA family antidote
MSAQRRGKAGNDRESLTPGAHLRAEIQRLGLDQVAVSKATGVSRQSINNIINGRQAISRAMAGKLGRLTGHGSDYWLAAVFSSKGKATRYADARTSGTGVLVNHQIIRAVTDGVIGIEPFDANNVRSASIDLTLGKGLTLAPGATVTARTKERIELPRDYLGRVGAAGPLASLGIIASHALHIEPGFKDRVDFCLFNASSSPCRLRAENAVITLEIVRLGATPDADIAT